jgi:AmmeMemoRadiSam system protein B
MEDTAYTCKKLRSPVVGGIFYPDTREETEEQLKAFGIVPGRGGRARMILAPHGAWEISGQVAAAGFSALSGRLNTEVCRIFVLGCIHREGEEGLFLSDSDCFLTPLGNLPVDLDICSELASCSSRFEINDRPHLREHSIEVLLPFLKFCFPQVRIIPILMGGRQPSLISILAKSLQHVFEPVMNESLCIVSCNISMNQDEALAQVQAEECLRLLLEKDSAGFASGLRDGRISACGGGLIGSLLESGLVDDKKAEIVSGPLIRAKGEENKTVCYGSLAYE